MKVDLKLPVVFWAREYDEIFLCQDVFYELNSNFKVKEIAFGKLSELGKYGVHWGIIYYGKKPKKKIIRDKLLDAGFIEDKNSKIYNLL